MATNDSSFLTQEDRDLAARQAAMKAGDPNWNTAKGSQSNFNPLDTNPLNNPANAPSSFTTPKNVGGQYYMNKAQADTAQRALDAQNLAGQNQRATTGVQNQLLGAGIKDLTPEQILANTENTPESIALMNKQYSEQSALQKRIQDMQRAAEAQQMEKARTQLGSQQASIEAATAQGMGGTQFSAKTAEAGIFGAAAQKQIDMMTNQYQMAEQERVQAESSLRAAREKGLVGAANSAQAALSEATKRAADAQALLLKTQSEHAKTAADINNVQRNAQQTTIENINLLSPGTVAGMNSKEIGSLFENAGLSATAGFAFKLLNSDLQAELEKGVKADPVVINSLQQQLGKVKSEPTAMERDIQTLAGLRDRGVITQENYNDAVKTKIGIEKPMSVIDARLKALSVEEKTLDNLTKRNNLQELQSTSTDGITILDKVENLKNGQSLNLEGISQKNQGECGAFVNNMLGSNKYGNTYASKYANHNSFTPKEGSIFISSADSGDGTGHVGIVRSLNNDGTATLVDMNKNGDGRISVRDVPMADLATKEKITAYEDTTLTQRNIKYPPDIQRAVDGLFIPGSGLSYTEMAKQYAGVKNVKSLGQFNEAVTDRRSTLWNSPEITDKLRSTAGQESVDAATIKSYQKGITVLSQLDSIASDIAKEKFTYTNVNGETVEVENQIASMLRPVTGWFASKNPWSADAQTMKAKLTALIPGLARGIYGEVGVLTDNDVALYSRTIPNLTNTNEVRDAVLGATLSVVRTNLQNELLINAQNGKDVSKFTGDIEKINKTIATINKRLNITDQNMSEENNLKTNPQGLNLPILQDPLGIR